MSGAILAAVSGMATTIVAGLGTALGAATTLATTAPVPPPELTEAIVQHFAARTAEALAERRGIKLRRPVRAGVIDGGRLRALLDEAGQPGAPAPEGMAGVDGSDPAVERRLVETRLGFLPADGARASDAGSREPQTTGPDPTGHYDPGTARVLVTWDADLSAGRLAVVRDVAQAILAQRFSLGSFLSGAPDRTIGPGSRGGSDALWARQALVEGDATIQALEHQETGGTLPDRRRLAELWETARAKLRSDPLYRASFGGSTLSVAARLFTGLDGAAFVAALRTREPWSSVDAIWAAPPDTAEQILHLEKYARREPAVAIGEAVPGTLARGWRLTYADTLGEVGARAFLEPAVGEHRAERAATGWGGDRVLVYRRSGDRSAGTRRAGERDDGSEADREGAQGANAAPDQPALVAWILAWDTPSDAEDFATQAAEVLMALAANDAESQEAAGPSVRRRAHGSVADAAGRVYAWQREGALVGLLFGAPPTAEAALGQLMAAVSSKAGAPPEKRRPIKSPAPRRGRSP